MQTAPYLCSKILAPGNQVLNYDVGSKNFYLTPAEKALAPLTVIRRTKRAYHGLLCLPEQGYAPITPPGQECEMPLFPVGLSHEKGGVCLVWPSTGATLEVLGAGAATEFHLSDVPVNLSAAPLPPGALLHFFELLSVQCPQRIITWIEEQEAETLRYLLRALLPCWPLDIIKAIATHMLGDTDICPKIAAALPGNAYFKEALTNLATWLPQRPRSSGLKLSSDMDGLDAARFTVAHKAQFHPTQRLLSAARSGVMPRKGACILATARNEGIYYLEWIAHHRSLGFEHFFIYSNDNDDGSENLLQALHQEGVITYIASQVAEGRSAQAKAYRHALNLLPDILDYRWTAILDLDEFIYINPERHDSIQDFVAFHDALQTSCCRLYWHSFLPHGLSHWPEEGISRASTTRLQDICTDYKSIIRTSQFSISGPHEPEPGVIKNAPTVNADGLDASIKTDERAFVAHYHLKSIDEYLWKCARGTGFDPRMNVIPRHQRLRFGEFYVAHFDSSAFPHDSRILRCSPGFERERQKLLANAAIREAFEHTKSLYQQKAAQLRQNMVEELSSAPDTTGWERHFLQLMLTHP